MSPHEGYREERNTPEIIHTDYFDILVNTKQRRVPPEEVADLVAKISSSQNPTSEWKSRFRYNVLFDSEDNPTLVAKTRGLASKSWWDTFKSTSGPVRPFPRNSLLAFQSLAHEIEMSPRVQEVLATDKAREVVAKYGFSRIEFVEPILGIINKFNGKKTMFYPYAKGMHFYEIERMKPEDWENLSQELGAVFSAKGIQAHDLKQVQYLIDGDTLNLIDIEGYTQEKK